MVKVDIDLKFTSNGLMKNELGFIPEIDAFYFKSGLILGNEFKLKSMNPDHMLNVLENGFNL